MNDLEKYLDKMTRRLSTIGHIILMFMISILVNIEIKKS